MSRQWGCEARPHPYADWLLVAGAVVATVLVASALGFGLGHVALWLRGAP